MKSSNFSLTCKARAHKYLSTKLVISLFLTLGISLKANAQFTITITGKTVEAPVLFQNLEDSLRPKIPLRGDWFFTDEQLDINLDKVVISLVAGALGTFIIKKMPSNWLGILGSVTTITTLLGILANETYIKKEKHWKYTFTLTDQDNNRIPGSCIVHFEPRFLTLDFEIDPCYLQVPNDMPMASHRIHTDSYVTKIVKFPQTVDGRLRIDGNISDWFMGQTKVVATGSVPDYNRNSRQMKFADTYNFLFDDNNNQIEITSLSNPEDNYCLYHFSKEDYEELSENILSLQNLDGINIIDLIELVDTIKARGEPYNQSPTCNTLERLSVNI